jgi:type III secretory pathway component EscT
MTIVDGWPLLVTAARVGPALVIGLAGVRVGNRTVAVAVAAMVAIALAAFAVPAVDAAARALATGGTSVRIVILGRELAIGTALGVVALIPIAAAELAGAWIASAVGDSTDGSAWSTATGSLAAVVFFGLGGHVALIDAVAASYRASPPGVAVTPGASTWLGLGATLLAEAVVLAVPLLGAVVVASLAIAAVERTSMVANGELPSVALTRAASVLGLAAMVFALALGVATLTRGLPSQLAAALVT